MIPEGTSVSTHVWAIQRDPRNFSPGADIFWPERWLLAEGLLQPKPHDFVHNPSAFIPFSYGPTNCVGKGLAMQEMRMVVCALIQRCSVRFADGYETGRWVDDMQDVQILKRGRLPVVVSVR
jgi:cytochrome P450